MANKKISALTSLGATPAGDDILPITDISDTTGSAQGTTKKVTVTNLVAAAPVQSVNGETGAVTVTSSGFSDIVTETTTSRTLSDSDNNKVIVCNNSSNITITVPTGLTSSFSCTIVQDGTGTVKVEGGATINAVGQINGTSGRYAHLNLIPIGTDSYVLEGEGQKLFANAKSLEFDGIGDELDSSGNMPLGSSGEFSVIAWFKTTDVDSGKEGILSFGSGSYFAIRTNSTNTEIRETSTAQSIGTHSTTDWNYVAVYYDGTNLKGTLNGAAFVSKASVQNTYTATDFDDGLKVGNLTVASQFFPGKIDEVAWWDSAVAEATLRDTFYNSGNGAIDLTSYSPNHWWRMGDSDTGSTISDE